MLRFIRGAEATIAYLVDDFRLAPKARKSVICTAKQEPDTRRMPHCLVVNDVDPGQKAW
jgi:hypothetical protein